MARADTFSKTNLAIAGATGFTIAAWAVYKLIWQNGLFATPFLPHRFCYLEQPGLIWTNAISDGLIWIAYTGLTLALAALLWMSKRLLPFRWAFVAFGLFIFACGFTHFMEVVTVWYPHYWLAAFIKVLTAIASLATLIAFAPLVPKAAMAIRVYRETYEQSQIQKEEALSQLQNVEGQRSAERESSLRALQQA